METKRNKKGQFIKGSSAPKTAFKEGGHPGVEFKKGQVPWNKNKKGVMPIPWNKDTKGVMKVNSGSFKKGFIPWNRDKRENIELVCLWCGEIFKVFPYQKDVTMFCSLKCYHKSRKGSVSCMKGKHHTEEALKKISEGIKENLPSTIFKKGERRSLATEYKKGERNLNWNNGSSFEPYGLEFNKELKEQIRQRDNYRCQECFRHQDELFTKNGKRYKLICHHIDYDKKNNNPKNLVSLCLGCHLQTNFSRENWTNYFSQKVVQNV